MVSIVDWLVFGIAFFSLLAIDIFLHRGSHVQSAREAGMWSIVWIGAGLLFTGYVGVSIDSERAQEYIGTYLIEKSLSLDNLFLFMLIFQTLHIPDSLQPKALLYGVFGALFFRALFIVAGIEAIEHFHWVTFLFGLILFWAAYQTVRRDPRRATKSRIVDWLYRHFKVSQEIHDSKFFVYEYGERKVSPFFVAIIGLELTDILFAIDSIPAALSVSRNIFIVYSSNAFAILGLRSLYLAMHGYLERYRYLHYGLGGILFFAGVKIVLAEYVAIPAWVSTVVTVSILTAAVWMSSRPRLTQNSKGLP